MCGIAGFFTGKPIDPKRFVLRSLILNRHRGTDAFGFMLGDRVWCDEGDPAKYMSGMSKMDMTPVKVCFVHNRAATRGKASDNNNNHPVVSDDNNWVVIHNGVVTCDKVPKYNYKGEVDTEEFVALCQDKGIVEAIKNTSGSMAIAVSHKLDDGSYEYFLYRKTSPMHFLSMGEKLVFHSEPESLSVLYPEYSSKIASLKPETLCRLVITDKGITVTDEKVEMRGYRVVSGGEYRGNFRSGYSYGWSADEKERETHYWNGSNLISVEAV